MGIEYAINFGSNAENEALSSLLVRLGGRPLLESPETTFEFRTSNSVGMPDASASISEGGLYFCDYGGSGRDFLGRLVAALVAEFSAVQVQEYEP